MSIPGPINHNIRGVDEQYHSFCATDQRRQDGGCYIEE